MKRLLPSVLLLIVALPVCRAADPDDHAAQLFEAGQYAEALAIWEDQSIKKPVAGLYYNAGLAHARLNQKVEAIYSFEQALRLQPCNKKIKDQLVKQRSALYEPVIPVKPFFLEQWYYGLIAALRPGQWALVSLLLLLSVVVHVMSVYQIIPLTTRFHGRIPYAVLSAALICMLMAFLAYHQLSRRNEAILIQQCDIHQGATTDSPVSRQVDAGEKIRLTDAIGSWYYVTLSNLDKGWVQKDCAKLIVLPGY